VNGEAAPERAGDAILVAGEALFDVVVDGRAALTAHPGGGPFNTARTIARLEQPVSFLGRLSTDRLGRTLAQMLADDGVRPDALVPTDDPTTLALAEVEADGSARYRFYERGTSAPGLTREEAIAALPASVSILHVGTLGLTLEPIATAVEVVVRALARDALVVVDPNCRPWAIRDAGRYRDRLARVLRRSHVVKVSQDDLAWLDPGRTPVAAARALLEVGPTVALVTLGAEGAVAVCADGDHPVAAPPAQVVDTIGAGDAFGGGFLAWWRAHGLGRDALADSDLVVEATRFAALVAARTVERAGAWPPRLSELGG
jgi:fructokinase